MLNWEKCQFMGADIWRVWIGDRWPQSSHKEYGRCKRRVKGGDQILVWSNDPSPLTLGPQSLIDLYSADCLQVSVKSRNANSQGSVFEGTEFVIGGPTIKNIEDGKGSRKKGRIVWNPPAYMHVWRFSWNHFLPNSIFSPSPTLVLNPYANLCASRDQGESV